MPGAARVEEDIEATRSVCWSLLRRESAALVLLALLFVRPAAGDDFVYPDDAYSCPSHHRWHSFETLCGIYKAGGNIANRAALYDTYDLSLVDVETQPRTRWHFKVKPGIQTQVSLMFHDYLRRRPEAITLRLKNQSVHAVRMTGILLEQRWKPKPAESSTNWILPCKSAVEPNEEAVLRFAVSDAQASPASGRAAPIFPAQFSIQIDGVLPGAEYELLLSELTVHYPSAPDLNVTAMDAPERVKAGKDLVVRLQCEGRVAGRALSLELRRDPFVLWRIHLCDEETRQLAARGACTVRRSAPDWLPADPLSLGLVADGYRVSGPKAQVQVASAAALELPRVERKVYKGRPSVLLNGKPFTWNGYASYDFEPGNVSEFGASGANVFVIPTNAGSHAHQVAAPIWRSPDAYDFGELDERVAIGLQANPEARLVLRVYLALPPFWSQAHPESLIRVRTAAGDFGWEETGSVTTSIASPEWRAQQEACLRRLINHCKSQPWAGRLLGFMLCGEVTEEWFAWACNDKVYGDYSPPNQAAFAAYCASKALAARTIPNPTDQTTPGRDLYPPDDAGRASAAYARFASEWTADTIGYFAKVVKDATAGRSLAGAFYGYVIQLAGEPRQHMSGHFALRSLLDDPNFDFFAGIPLHNFRSLDNGYDTYASATETILRAGKLYINESDLFSWLHHDLWYTEYDSADPRHGAIAMHQRVLADDAVHGALRQWFSLVASWHHDPGLQQEFSRQIALSREVLRLNRAPAEEIAFVVDDTSFAWYPPETALPRITNADWQRAWARTGAPIGVWLLSDLDRLPDRIRVVIVANAPAAASQDLEQLKHLLAHGKRTVIVQGCVGLIDPETQQYRPDRVAALTGLPVTVRQESLTGVAQRSDTGAEVSSVAALNPRAEIAQGAFLQYADGAGAADERPLARGGRLIWCGVPPMDSALLRSWLEAAGVHCYAPIGFTVYAAHDLVGITAPEAAQADLTWPKASRVVDLLDGWSGTGEILSCPFERGQTRLFKRQPAAAARTP